MTRAPLFDEAARNQLANDLDVSVFAEAGAGTGKTSSLVGRIVNTLTDADEPVSVREIAAITFTERAATELRSRVRAELAKRSAAGSGELVDRALEDVDAAAIGTIHGFALAILREHALAAELPVGFSVVDEATGQAQQRQRWREIHARLTAELQPATRKILNAAGIRVLDLDALATDVDKNRARLAAHGVDWTYRVDEGEALAAVAAELRDFAEAALDECTNDDDRLAVHFREWVLPLCNRFDQVAAQASDKALEPTMAMLRGWDSRGAADQADDVGWSKAFYPGTAGSARSWGSLVPKQLRGELKVFVKALRDALFAPVEKALRDALDLMWNELDVQYQIRRSEGLLEFDDILLMARDLLTNDPEVRAAVHSRYRVVMVDEFQDTDPVQWEIISLVTSDPGDDGLVPMPGHLVVVGDPKQAIYSFRGADISTYLGARRGFAGERLALVSNFRTVGPVLTWVNKVFGSAIVESAFQSEYVDLGIRHEPTSSQPIGPAVVVLAKPPTDAAAVNDDELDDSDDESPAQASTPEQPKARALEPKLVAAAIKRAVTEQWQITEPDEARKTRHYAGAARYRDVAILLPTRTGMDRLLEALDDLYIPYRSADAGLVYHRPIVEGLIAAVAFISDPQSQIDMWAALKSPLFGCSDIDLLAYRRAGGYWRLPHPDAELPDGPVSDALRLLANVRRMWVSPQPIDVLRALADQCRVFETLTVSPRGDFDADCVRMIINHAQDWQADGGIGLDAYLAWVREAVADSSRTSLAEPDDRDDDAVRIMTVHAAKGLEFPIVVVAGMATQRKSTPPVVGIRFDGRVEFSTGAPSTRNSIGRLRTCGFDEWDEDERKPREDAELLRLLYVACTRARDHLIVSVLSDEGKSDPSRAAALREHVLAAGFGPDVERMWQVPEFPVVDDEAHSESAVLPSLPAGWDDTLASVRERSQKPSVASPSGIGAVALGVAASDGSVAASEEGVVEPEESEGFGGDDGAARLSRASRDGRPLGRAVHAAFDDLLTSGVEPSDKAIAQACERAAAAEGIPSSASDVRERVAAGMESDLIKRALAAPRRWCELYLAAPVDVDGVSLVEGYADLVFIGSEPGAGLVLVDYKTDAAINDETLAHYREQLAAYSELLQRATGLPVDETHVLHLPGTEATSVKF